MAKTSILGKLGKSAGKAAMRAAGRGIMGSVGGRGGSGYVATSSFNPIEAVHENQRASAVNTLNTMNSFVQSMRESFSKSIPEQTQIDNFIAQPISRVNTNSDDYSVVLTALDANISLVNRKVSAISQKVDFNQQIFNSVAADIVSKTDVIMSTISTEISAQNISAIESRMEGSPSAVDQQLVEAIVNTQIVDFINSSGIYASLEDMYNQINNLQNQIDNGWNVDDALKKGGGGSAAAVLGWMLKKVALPLGIYFGSTTEVDPGTFEGGIAPEDPYVRADDQDALTKTEEGFDRSEEQVRLEEEARQQNITENILNTSYHAITMRSASLFDITADILRINAKDVLINGTSILTEETAPDGSSFSLDDRSRMGGIDYSKNSSDSTGANSPSGVPNWRAGESYSPTDDANEMQSEIVRVANNLGVSPEDLATIMSYETAGTMDPYKGGPTTKWGKHRGLIQWGEPQAEKYGLNLNPGDPNRSTLRQQMDAVEKYFRDEGFIKWMEDNPDASEIDIRRALYATVNAGNPERITASDEGAGGAPGNVIDKVDDMFYKDGTTHYSKSKKFMAGTYETHRPETPKSDTEIADLDLEPNARKFDRSIMRKGDRGEFNWSTSKAGQDYLGFDSMNKSDIEKHLKKIKTNSGQEFIVHEKVAERATNFLNALEESGYPIEGDSYAYSYRRKAKGNSLSTHSTGTTLDINPSKNWGTYGPKGNIDMDEDVEKLANYHGFSWGGRFGDPMHFELMDPSLQEERFASLEKAGYVVKKPEAEIKTAKVTPEDLEKSAELPPGPGMGALIGRNKKEIEEVPKEVDIEPKDEKPIENVFARASAPTAPRPGRNKPGRPATSTDEALFAMAMESIGEVSWKYSSGGQDQVAN